MEFFSSFGELPAVLKVALPLLLIFMIGAFVKRLMKFVLLIAILILAIVFLYPLFDF